MGVERIYSAGELLDSGLPSSGLDLEKTLLGLGVPMADIDLLVLSHEHVDHVGGLTQFFTSANCSRPVWGCRGGSPLTGDSRLRLFNWVYQMDDDYAAFLLSGLEVRGATEVGRPIILLITCITCPADRVHPGAR
jgi:glyoxylase-like metal-dependent hydrolase (beta-lactamase superfamily II)